MGKKSKSASLAWKTALFLTLALPATAQEWKKHVVVRAGKPLTAVAADYTGDGKVDVITNVDSSVRLYAAPDWKETVLHRAPRLNLIHSETFDVDGDGDPDYLGAMYQGPIFWLENPGGAAKGPWKVRLANDTLRGAHALIKGDLDGDGKLDLVAGSGLSDAKSTFPNSIGWLKVPKNPRNAEGWHAFILAKGDSPGLNHYFGIGDVNGDGRPDVCAGAKGSPKADPPRSDASFAWWEAPADPTKPWKKHMIADNIPGATNIHPAEVNGDGKVDFIASRGHDKGILWYEAPDWKAHTIHAELESPHSLVVADLDGDGDSDAATCAFGSRQAWWYENLGGGKFRNHLVAGDQSSYDIRAVDMDGDGDLDLVIAGRDSANVVWCENPTK